MSSARKCEAPNVHQAKHESVSATLNDFLREKATVSTLRSDCLGLFSYDIQLLWQILKFYIEIKKASNSMGKNDQQLLTWISEQDKTFQKTNSKTIGEC